MIDTNAEVKAILAAVKPLAADYYRLTGKPLGARVGKYVKALEASYPLRDVSKQIIKSSINIFERFNYVRNNDSLAHDNELPDDAQAHFIFESVTTILRFVKRVEADRFGT